MRPVGRCDAVLVAVTVLICQSFSTFAKPPLLPSVQGERRAIAATDDAGTFSDLWKLFDAAADGAYQKQLYRDSADICLVSYLVATAAEDQVATFRSAWLMAFSYHFQGAADAALTAYRLALDHVIPGHLVSLENDQNDVELAS